MTSTSTHASTSQTRSHLPINQLLVLSVAGFVTMLTETVPAGLLPRISDGLHTSNSTSGQLLTVYAAASTLAAIPLVARTARVDRKRVIVATVMLIALANLLTGLAPVFWIAVAARIVSGTAAALQWALLAGFAMRLVEPRLQGRALSIAMAGIPLALAVGVPTGALLGAVISWRGVFVALAILGVLLAAWALTVLPPAAPQQVSGPPPLRRTIRVTGLIPVFVGAGLFQLGHMLLYTYISPFLHHDDPSMSVSAFLLVLGLAAVAGLAVTGTVIDKQLRSVAFVAMALFVAAMLLLATFASFGAIYSAAVVWGLGLGAAPTIYQTAAARVAGTLVDTAQSLLVTIFNAGMALGSAIGGLALSAAGPALLPWISLLVFGMIVGVLVSQRHSALPRHAADITGPASDVNA